MISLFYGFYFSSTNVVKKRIEKAKSLLDATSLKVGEIALMVGYKDTNYFSLAFKKHTGKSFTQLQQAIRFRKACFFLENTNKSIAEISELIGFNNVEHFNRLFKKIYASTPGQYRKEKN